MIIFFTALFRILCIWFSLRYSTYVVSDLAFGIEEKTIDMERVKNSAHIAKIDSFIEETKYSYETNVGERGYY